MFCRDNITGTILTQITRHIVPLPVLKCFSMSPVWFSFIAPELLCKSYMITTSLLCTALYHSSGFFIMSPAEGLYFSALVISWICYYDIIALRNAKNGLSC